MYKKQILTILFSTLLLITFSQNLLVDGVYWNYTNSIFLSDNESATHYIEGDTIINNVNCKILNQIGSCNGRPEREFIFVENNKLYYYQSNINDFNLLYDFNLQVDDSLVIPSIFPFSSYLEDSIYLIVDSISYIPFDTLELKMFHCKLGNTYLYDSLVYNKTANFIEQIGNLGNFFFLDNWGACDQNDIYQLRCFTHPQYGTMKFIEEECEIILDSKDFQFQNQITFFPNPTSGIVNFNIANNQQNLKIEVFNEIGKLISTYNNIQNNAQISLKNKGINFLKIYVENEVVAVKKILVIN